MSIILNSYLTNIIPSRHLALALVAALLLFEQGFASIDGVWCDVDVVVCVNDCTLLLTSIVALRPR